MLPMPPSYCRSTDQLHFVEAFEIGHLGRIPRLGQRFVTGLDQRRQPAAEHGLLAEQIGLGFFL
jgi:hypothetical protein